MFRNAILLSAAAVAIFSAMPAAAQSVVFKGSTFTNDGLVGVARVPSNARDKYGETLGGWGSAMAFVPGSWKMKNGTYTGNLVAVPDRGWNTQGTLDFRGRTQHFKASFVPFYGASTTAQNQLTLDYKTLTAMHLVKPTTGLDAVKVLVGGGNFPDLPAGEDGHLAVDNEGIVFTGDGTFWVSDEYGPYVYHYAAGGRLLNAIRPPEAFIPRRLDTHGNPVENFSANSPPIGESYNRGNPVSGRQNNQGFEGLAISPDGKTLSVLLQSALIQDLKTTDITHTRRNTRLLQYDITDPMHPQLVHEYAVQLPTFTNAAGNANLVAAQSELHALNNHQFMVLARDSSVGETFPATPASVYRSVDLIDTDGATDLAAPGVYAAYNGPTGQIAPNGVLLPAIAPVAYQKFLNIDDNSQLNRFGLHNGAPNDSNDLYEKWESIDIEAVNDPAAPNDYFLFVASDNDFITQNGFMVQQNGSKTPQPYSDASGFNADTLVLVYRVTLPTYVPPAPPGGAAPG
jgi:hypothetical protein